MSEPEFFLQNGVVARLNADAGFGYVRDTQGVHQYIFVVGEAIPPMTAAKLRVGNKVQFHLDDKGRVDRLELG